jgi:hypothetical protein
VRGEAAGQMDAALGGETPDNGDDNAGQGPGEDADE